MKMLSKNNVQVIRVGVSCYFEIDQLQVIVPE